MELGIVVPISKNYLKGKILGAYYIKISQPLLNNQINSELLKLLRNAVT